MCNSAFKFLFVFEFEFKFFVLMFGFLGSMLMEDIISIIQSIKFVFDYICSLIKSHL